MHSIGGHIPMGNNPLAAAALGEFGLADRAEV
jgi:hypothetical protein